MLIPIKSVTVVGPCYSMGFLRKGKSEQELTGHSNGSSGYVYGKKNRICCVLFRN